MRILHGIKLETSVVLTGTHLLIELYAERKLFLTGIYFKIYLRSRCRILFSFKL